MVKIRYGERQERGPEGQENEWKYAAPVGWDGVAGESIKSPRDLGWGRSQDSMLITLVKIPNSGVMEHEETTSSIQIGSPLDEW